MEMVTVVFILAVISIGLIFSVFALLQCRHQAKKLKSAATANESELLKLRNSEQTLRYELSTLKTKLRHAIEDPVTGLPGWQLFEDRVNQSIVEGARYQLTMGILYIDIDDFKVINDALGNDVGNAVLRELSVRLKSCIRQVDSISRFAKDTFAVLLTQLGKPETAAIVAQRMLQALAQPVQVNEHHLYLTACIGISIYPSDGQDAATLFRSADHALRMAKEKGNQIYQFFQEKIFINSQRELALSTGIKRDSLPSEFLIFYQPIKNMLNEKIFCMEALLHWQHPELGLIAPAELVAYAEKQGKLNVISEWLLKNACRQFTYWRTLNFYPDFLGISMSIRQLENSHFVYRISQVLQELDFNPEWLLLEIRENISQISFDVLEKAFNMIKYLNIKIAIDDFGAGPFSLRDIKHSHVNYLKLDQNLLDDIEQNEQSVDLAKSLIQLSKSLHAELVIKGIDSDHQALIWKGLGCNLMQGRLIGTQISEKEVVEKMVTK
jgi:diguanylate cyclase (GGDEF)-like protein